MKHNIIDIMKDLRPGHILIASNGREYVFEEAKKTQALLIDRETGKKVFLKGMVELTPDIDVEWAEKIEEEAINEFLQTRRVQKMKPGQHFIASNGNEYIFVKFKRTKFVCIDADNKTDYFDCIANFVKDELEKNTDLGAKCMYCGSFNFHNSPEILCPGCQETFGHSLYSEL